MHSKRIFLLLPFLLILFASGSYLVRDLWFDEALTVQNFALLSSWGEIYRNYVIPNNQLLYTFALHSWIPVNPGFFAMDDWMRLLTFLLAIALLALLFFGFRKTFGTMPLLTVLTAFALSPVFLLHATALRGYMAGALFTALALRTGLDFAVSGKKHSWLLFFLCSLGAVAVLPSDLMALTGVLLYMLPCFGKRFYISRRFYAAILAVPAAFLLFYLPIWRNFLLSAKVGSNEAWNNPAGVLLAVFTALAGSFAILLPSIGAAALLGWKRPHFSWLRRVRGVIWLLPVLTVLILPKPPFPRVFFPLFPLYVLLIAALFRDISCRYRLRRHGNMALRYAGFFLLVLCWSAAMQNTGVKLAFSRLCGGAGRDDFFYSYHLRPEFSPRKTARFVNEYLQKEGTSLPCYMSFQADPWPLMFYLRLTGAPISGFLFDGPRGRVENLPDPALVILHHTENRQETVDRFPGTWRLLEETPGHRIWRVSR